MQCKTYKTQSNGGNRVGVPQTPHKPALEKFEFNTVKYSLAGPLITVDGAACIAGFYRTHTYFIAK